MRILALLLGLGLQPLWAEGVSIRLDQANPGTDQCQLVFVLDNATATEFEQIQAEIVLLSHESRVVRLSLLDFQDLPAQGLRVRSFTLPGVDCADLGRVLFNALAVCTPLAAKECSAALWVGSNTDIEVLK
ncbi:MAG: hypothetical protein LAT78_10915 [Roseinatronobacter sp.]|jgi:hypothetical protein|nr:hypothetical protein [Roseinatronobacter sp.]